MTDPWSRDAAPEPSRGPVFEIPLEGDGPLIEQRGSDDVATGAEPRNWRKVTGVASIAGVLLGALIVIGLLAFGGDGTGEDGGQATDATVEASELTTPPTLGPLEVLPIPGDSDGPSTAQDGPVLTLPQYIEDPANGADIPDNLQLKAITGLVDDVARRSTIEYRSTSDSGLSITISRDPTSDRYELILTPVDVEGSLPTTSIVDVASGYVYTAGFSVSGWVGQSMGDTGDGGLSMDGLQTILQGMLLGPLRSDTYSTVISIESGPTVRLPPMGTAARRFDVAIPAAAVPEWARFEFGNNPGFRIGPDEVLDYEVFVDETGSIVLAQGANSFDGQSQSVVYSTELLDPAFTIGIPSEDQVTDFEDYLRAIDTSSPEALRPVYADTPDDNLGDVDVSVALANLAADPPMRSVVTDRTPNATFSITTEFDAATNRTATTYQLSNPGDLTVREIEDLGTNRVLRQNRNDERWLSESIDSRGTAADRRYLTGLVDPALLADSPNEQGSHAVMLDDGSTVRLFQFSVDAAKIELPIDVALQLLGENPAVVYVYVDEDNVLRELQILSNGNDSPEVVVQRFVYLEDAPVVTLPDPSVVDDA